MSWPFSSVQETAWDAYFRAVADHPFRDRGPKGVVLDRKASQSRELECNAGCRIIGPRRSNSAHLHRPWRATSYRPLFPVLSVAPPRPAAEVAPLHSKLSIR
jgi:hypothetical protein